LVGVVLKPEVVNRSEDDSISVHVNIASIKYVYFLYSPAKHKNPSTNRVFNDSSNFVVREGDEQWLQQSTIGPVECSVLK
jgi:hypothetical protein